jgi:hypothetical protein
MRRLSLSNFSVWVRLGPCAHGPRRKKRQLPSHTRALRAIHFVPLPPVHSPLDSYKRRLSKPQFFVKENDDSNIYGRPLEGLEVVVDLASCEVVSFKDRKRIPVPPYDELSAWRLPDGEQRATVKVKRPCTGGGRARAQGGATGAVCPLTHTHAHFVLCLLYLILTPSSSSYPPPPPCPPVV